MRRDGLARAAKMYRVPQAGPRQPAVAGPVVERGVMPHSSTTAARCILWVRATGAMPSRLEAEQGRYSAAAASAKAQRLAARGVTSPNDSNSCSLTGRLRTMRCLICHGCPIVFGCLQFGYFTAGPSNDAEPVPPSSRAQCVRHRSCLACAFDVTRSARQPA